MQQLDQWSKSCVLLLAVKSCPVCCATFGSDQYVVQLQVVLSCALQRADAALQNTEVHKGEL